MKHTRRLFRLAAAMLSVVALCSCGGSAGPGIHLVSGGSGEKKPLKLNLKKGETYKVNTEMEGEYTVGEGATSITASEKNGMTMSFYVADVVEGGTMSVDVRYARIMYRAQGPMGVIEFDSSYPSEQVHPAIAGFKALVGKGFRLNVAPDGTVKEVKGIDKMLDQIIAGMELPPGAGPDMTKEDLKANLKKEYDEKNIESRMKGMLGEYPVEPVGVGACWTATGPGFYPPCSIEAKYTLTARENGIATIQVNAVLKPDKTLVVGGFTFDVNGGMNGILEVEEKTGLPVKGALMLEASGTRTGTGKNSVSTPFSLKGNMTVRKEQ